MINYKSIFNNGQGWLVNHNRARIKTVLCLTLSFSLTFSPAAIIASTLPTGGDVTAGSGSINQTDTDMTIDQTSQNMIIDWQGFSIGENSSVTFDQPSGSSTALNRVIGSEISHIQGVLKANGRVFLINQSGVLFSSTASVNVGDLVVSTLNISNEDFMSGNYDFSGSSPGQIINRGDINAAAGGYIVFIAAKIENTGTITANRGGVLLGAGSRVLLDLGGPVKLEVEEAAIDALIEQGGAIRADGGLVYITAKAAGDLASTVINHTGITEARTLSTGEKGEICLLGDMENDRIAVGGTLDASAPDGGNGGFIETSAAKVSINNDVHVTTKAEEGETGTWLIDPNDFTIAATGGDMTGATVSGTLGTTDLTIETATMGTPGGNGDIFVNDTVSWSDNTLTLTAERDVNINAEMTATGTAGLVMNTGTGSVKVGFNDGEATGFKGKVNLAGTVSLAINGNSYTMINDIEALQGDMYSSMSGYYALGADIDASATTAWNSDGIGGYYGFDPIGDSATKFTGTFAGLGHTVTGLFINRPTEDNVGLFGYTNGAAISNVGLEGGSVSGHWYVGGLVGRNYSSTVSNCYATGSVSGGIHAGGLVGYNESSPVSNSYATGGVTASSGYVGGLVGTNFSHGTGTISGSYATGSVTGTGDRIGGLVGYCWDSSTISNCYATGSVSGGNLVGGLVGYNDMSSAVSGSYATGSVSGSGCVGGLVGETVGGSTVTNSYATGSVSGGSYVGGLVGYNDSSTVSGSYATGSVTGTGDRIGGLVGYNWESCTISNCYATGSVSGNNYVGGLVGYNYKGTVSVSYATGSVSGTLHVGGLVGYCWDSSIISNCYATGSVSGNNLVGGLVGCNNYDSTVSGSYATGSVSGGSYVGGLVGYNDSSTVSGSYATGGVTGAGNMVGGLVGNNWDSSTISNCYATGSVSGGSYVGGLVGYNDMSSAVSGSYATGSVSGSGVVGGLVGYNDSSTVSNSYATGGVTGAGNMVGGLVGVINESTVSDSYATGTVNGNDYVGGLVGFNQSSNITNAYATGGVTGGSGSVGGLVGEAMGGCTVTNSYWDVDATHQTTSAGGTGKTTTEMMQLATFSEWSISGQGGEGTIWRIYEGSTYPLLRSFFRAAPTIGLSISDKVYDGTDVFQWGYSLQAGFDDAFVYSEERPGYMNVGTYSISDIIRVYSDQLGYDLVIQSPVDPTADITRRPVDVVADPQTKIEAESDPPLTYQAEAQAGDRGLVTGESLTGALTREIGELIGNYEILQGTVDNGNNLNYDIRYASAYLTITKINSLQATKWNAQNAHKGFPGGFYFGGGLVFIGLPGYPDGTGGEGYPGSGGVTRFIVVDNGVNLP